ncbi:MAG: hypothetical protein ACKPE3_24045, partial [Sphaerospermopsis kisseleviana]
MLNPYLFFSRSQSQTGNAIIEALPLLCLLSYQAEPDKIHSHTEYGNEKITSSPVPSPQSPVTSHQSPVPSPQSPVTSPQSPVTSPQSPVPSPQSPVPSHQSPVTSPQSPVTSPQ